MADTRTTDSKASHQAAPVVPHVYEAINAVMEAIGKTGIAKSRNNQQQGYKFRGIDDVYNELNGLLSAHKLLMLPVKMTPEHTERQTKSGGVIFYARVTVDFKLISARDGSSEMVQTLGEAMDSADKSSNKAQSAAYKYAAMQVFCIPTEGDNDADAVTHEIAPKTAAKTADPKPPTLTERAARLEATLKGSAGNPAKLRKAYDLAAKLCADLDASDPERLAEIAALYERLLNESEQEVFS